MDFSYQCFQVYNKGEDNDATCALFGLPEFLNASDDMKKSYMKRGRELLAKKYRFTWNKKKTRESLQQGCHLMIWSDNDVANDFTIKKHEDGEQFYPEAFLQCGIEKYREYQRQLWEPELTPMPEDDEFFQEYHSHTYGPIGIFLMDIRGNRITGDGKLQSERPVVRKGFKTLIFLE